MPNQNVHISGVIRQKRAASGSVSYRAPISGVTGVGSKPIRELWFGPRNDFPTIGSPTMLYTDTDNSVIYYWSGTAYLDISGNVQIPIVAKTKAEWAVSTSIKSNLGWIYIYIDYRQEEDHNIPAIKIGDGNAFVVDLPFFDTGVTESDRQRWDNKVAATLSDSDDENLILYTD